MYPVAQRRARKYRSLYPADYYSPWWNDYPGLANFGTYGNASFIEPMGFGLDKAVEVPNTVEDATRAHVEAKRDYEKAQEKYEEAKKKFEQCEKKVKEAEGRLNWAKAMGRYS